MMRPVDEEIGPDVVRAFGSVVSEECQRLGVSTLTVARRGDFEYSMIEAFHRGRRQPKLAAFIALAWALHEEPRDLFDKLLTAMHLPPGRRPVLNRG
jgi:hypothetical protein